MSVILPKPEFVNQAIEEKKLERTKQPETITPQSVNNKSEPILPELVKDARNAILNGMTMKEFDKYYPELKETDKTVFEDLEADVKK